MANSWEEYILGHEPDEITRSASIPSGWTCNLSNTAAASRLNEQHHVFTGALGFLLHPNIAKTLPPNCSIAEVATGTAIWLTSVAKTLPESTTFVGFDINSSKFPAADSLPSNITLHTLDAKAPCPPAWARKFDVVHARYLVCAMDTAGDWAAVTAHAAAMLKPGGWLQWTEADPSSTLNPYRSADSTPGPLHAISRVTRQAFGYVFPVKAMKGYNTIPQELIRLGFNDVWQDLVSSDRRPEDRPKITKMMGVTTSAMLRSMAAQGVAGAWSVREIEEAMEAYAREAKDGAYVVLKFATVFGRKPV